MSDDTFFDSQVVGDSLADIVDLQYEVLAFAEVADYATIGDQKKNLVKLRTLLEKQKNMFFRCQLSKSKAAKELHDEILMHLQENGHTIDWHDPIKIFDQLSEELDDIELDIRNQEERGM